MSGMLHADAARMLHGAAFVARLHRGKVVAGTGEDPMEIALRVVRRLHDAGEADADVLVAAFFVDVRTTDLAMPRVAAMFGARVAALIAEIGRPPDAGTPAVQRRAMLAATPRLSGKATRIRMAWLYDELKMYHHRELGYRVWMYYMVEAMPFNDHVVRVLRRKMFLYTFHVRAMTEPARSEALEAAYRELDERN
jgi:hypothetical protein